MSNSISKEAAQRMEGLVSITFLKDLGNTVDNIQADLLDEGFEPEEVKAYLVSKVSEMADKFFSNGK